MTVEARYRRRLGAGAELQPDGVLHVRVWAPRCRTLDVVMEGREPVPLEADRDGFFGGTVDDVSAGDRYWLRLDGERLRPDPVSRFQPEGPHGPSAVVDPASFQWTDGGWKGIRPEGQVLYEIHVGTFTREGTWPAAARHLRELKALGITVLEIMPIADFPGRFGWGYDGVNLYAPTRLYGVPDDLRTFVDRAHAEGLGVILDVVYNHVGPDGNYLAEFSRDYFTDRYSTDWGAALNFEGPRAARDFFVENAGYWIDEFHFDGLRLDATQDIHDESPRHVIADIVRRAREAAGARRVYIIAENEPQETVLVRPQPEGGCGVDALWNDDYHHTSLVALTGRREAYYTDYTGSPQELISCAKYGYLYQGQWYSWQGKPRGSSALDLPAHAFVAYLENHDQVANSAFGRRLHQVASPGRLRALTALTLLGPATPLLFQGQEFGSSAPFLYFADHRDELHGPIARGRRAFLKQFDSLADPDTQDVLPPPLDAGTWRRCALDDEERRQHGPLYLLHRDLIALRHRDGVINGRARLRVDGAVLGPGALVLRYFGGAAGDRLLVVNLGCDLDFRPAPEPLLAPPPGARWELRWNSSAATYGGEGRQWLVPPDEWRAPAETAVLLSSAPHAGRDDDD